MTRTGLFESTGHPKHHPLHERMVRSWYRFGLMVGTILALYFGGDRAALCVYALAAIVEVAGVLLGLKAMGRVESPQWHAARRRTLIHLAWFVFMTIGFAAAWLLRSQEVYVMAVVAKALAHGSFVMLAFHRIRADKRRKSVRRGFSVTMAGGIAVAFGLFCGGLYIVHQVYVVLDAPMRFF